MSTRFSLSVKNERTDMQDGTTEHMSRQTKLSGANGDRKNKQLFSAKHVKATIPIDVLSVVCDDHAS